MDHNETQPNPAAPAHAGEPQAGEKSLVGPETVAGSGSIETAAREEHLKRLVACAYFEGHRHAQYGKPIIWRLSETKRQMDNHFPSGGTSPETGKAPAPESMASPQKRQHAGEGKDAERYRALRRFLTVDRDEPGEWTCWLALACVPYRSKTENPDDIVDKIIEAFAERAPLVGRGKTEVD